MRHSWISELCNSGNHSIQGVAAWSGDTLDTIESNDWHKKSVSGALDATLSGKRKDEDILEKLDEILAGGGKPADVLEEIRRIAEKSRVGESEPLTLDQRLGLRPNPSGKPRRRELSLPS